MKFLVVAFSLMAYLSSCAQTEKFDLSTYIEVERKPNLVQKDTILYMVLYKNKEDGDYSLIRFFEDSLCSTMMMERFYYRGILNGPFRRFDPLGRVELAGQYKNGVRHGQFILYNGGKLEMYQHFDNGNKVGTWEEFDKEGNVSRRIKFAKDKMVEEQHFQNGKLIRITKY